MTDAFTLFAFEDRVAGIPCLIAVHSWEPYVPAQISGPPEHCYPAEGGEGEWSVLDRRGRPAPWLERKLTEAERERIDQLVFDVMENRV
ncbi:hypothetical protein [Bordetella phage CN2]|uniref:Uncharacterized protein n=1 Tax=Bordetella phage CN2 TaxID=1916124 RepID=A0A2D0W9F1_9CAUD|nr:hypothetical protein HOS30_gp48 [Bordetella phage CN2]APL99266.1 hypothetical protein [Bordetella phage CN2]